MVKKTAAALAAVAALLSVSAPAQAYNFPGCRHCQVAPK